MDSLSEKPTPVAPVQNIVHTPGPWEAVRSLTCGHLRAAHNYQVDPKEEWTDADLKLISAAPEMLYCLQRLSPVVNDYDFRCSPEGKVLSDRINALLAKVV